MIAEWSQNLLLPWMTCIRHQEWGGWCSETGLRLFIVVKYPKSEIPILAQGDHFRSKTETFCWKYCHSHNLCYKCYKYHYCYKPYSSNSVQRLLNLFYFFFLSLNPANWTWRTPMFLDLCRSNRCLFANLEEAVPCEMGVPAYKMHLPLRVGVRFRLW